MDKPAHPSLRDRLLHGLLRPGVLAALVLAVCSATTCALWLGARADAEREAETDFNHRVRELINNMAQRMQTYVQVLYGVQGLFASVGSVDREAFRIYLAGQELNQHFPGVQGVGFMRWVPGSERAAHIAAVQAEGFPEYAITPAGIRPQYAPVLYLEPFSGSNLRAFGFDPMSEPMRRMALEQARDSGLPAMTGRLRLVQEKQDPGQAGFLVLLPVYRKGMPQQTLAQRRAAIEGWVYAPFRMGDLMAGIGGERGASLDVEIYDGNSVDPAQRMYDSGAGHPGAGDPAATARQTTQQISVASHRWTVRIAALPESYSLRDEKTQLIGIAGLMLSVLMALLAWLLAQSRARTGLALHHSRELAAELQEGQASMQALADSAQRSQAMLRSILDSTIDGILVDDCRGTVLNVNRRFRQLWNVPEHMDWQSDGPILMAHVAGQLEQAEPFLEAGKQPHRDNEERQALLHLKDGRVMEQFTRTLRLGSGQARLWSFRDITERTQIDQREQTRRQVLELLATGAPLSTILESVVLGIEADNPSMLCSILLLDPEGRRLLVGAAPSLPAFFNAAIHGQPAILGNGSCGQAVAANCRVIVENIQTDPLWLRHRDLARRAGLGACWSDPIRSSSGAVLGAFAIYSRLPQRPSPANITLIEQAAHLAGIAIEQAQAAQALRVEEARFRSLYDNAPVALWEQDWSEVRARLVELEMSGVEDIPAYLHHNPSQLKHLASLVRITDVNAAALQQVGALPSNKDLSVLSLAQNFDHSALPAFARALTALAQGAHLFACESSFRRLDGVGRQNELTLLVMPGHAHSLDFVIVSTVDITERKRLNDELLLLATTDFLTGLPNRREFMARLDDEQARLQRDVGERTAVVMLDLDHFKRINDEHGHAAGDAVLRHLATLMRDSQRKIDMLGRVGGEEFAVLLPGADLAAASSYAERLRQRIASTPLLLGEQEFTVTVSVGIAAMDALDASGDAALIRADKALYRAKRGGRNRVEVAGRDSAAAEAGTEAGKEAGGGAAKEADRPEHPPAASA
ncbi:CHASE domain-containing protein [Massilia sp. BJB1822]|uniref:sensor domain-containing diguanylate cyclase n=1 Tax=Massilia sp. BJB1822 TaxID=2744470 RepID=UPI00159415BA|nr:CHASE domain-containing protein [Massilia sp. BJB1822]NVE01572.1 CHASE domain-containing protein [Massilia sp. BJB1822]